MARICEICGRKDETLENDHDHDLLDVCEACTNDRHYFMMKLNDEGES